jgi:thermitase
VMVMAVLVAFSGVALAQQGERTTTTATDPPPSFRGQEGERFAPNQLIVQLRDGAAAEDLEELNRRHGARTDKELAPNLVPGLYRVRVTSGLAVRDAVSRYEASDDVVDFAEPDFIQEPAAISPDQPNDPYYTNGSLWGLKKIKAWDAWNLVTGQSLPTGTYSAPLVAVIDEGVQFGHSDLNKNVWQNHNEVSGIGGQDDDPDDGNGLGKVDDVYGWDEYQNNNSVYDGKDDNHGTHVAGTIGAVGNNSTGVTGVNWQTAIGVCKFLGPAGGSTSDAISCLDYVVKELGAKVSNNSWGGGGYSQGLYNAIKTAGEQYGHLFVAAAGNGGSDSIGDNNDADDYYPASYGATYDSSGKATGEGLPNVIAVASTTNTTADNKSGFSNYGKISVDLGAPGSGIYSTVPGGRRNPSAYASYSGTSMATPHVTGTVALIWAKNPGLTASQVKDLILNNVDPVASTSSLYNRTVSGGRLNAYKAVNAAPLPTTQ